MVVSCRPVSHRAQTRTSEVSGGFGNPPAVNHPGGSKRSDGTGPARTEIRSLEASVGSSGEFRLWHAAPNPLDHEESSTENLKWEV